MNKILNPLKSRSSLFALASFLALVVLLATPGRAVFAQGNEGQTQAVSTEGENPQDGNVVKAFLERRFQRQTNRLERASHMLEQAGEREGNFEERIAALASEGKDVTGLQAGLEQFRAAIAAAQGYYGEAEVLLSAHVGFDGEGHVTDVEQARTTLATAQEPLQNCFQSMRDAVQAVKEAIRTFRQANSSNVPDDSF
jgi:hypothetical protein